MEVFEAVRTVLAVRSYSGKSVPRDVVHRIVEAGRLSASAMNAQPWHFVVVQEGATLRALGEIIKTGRYTAGASCAVVVVLQKASKLVVSDASRAVQSMILTAWSDGVGSNWVGFGPLPDVQKLLGVPETHWALAVCPFGYPVATIGRGHKNRRPLGEVASRERFGTPFA